MPASERETRPRQQQLPPQPSVLSMRELLASCAAASAVSTPPRDEQPAERPEGPARRDAA
ncbi:hypothetical protein AB0M39_05205 [Streptomyces sp. NPDC051907]|uniref:hypothetical protein n=1 Tax=Streptomyces sp. NPDC051907 TaxID=3155284 RepID=UPI00342499DC